jgi:hypothetical protein
MKLATVLKDAWSGLTAFLKVFTLHIAVFRLYINANSLAKHHYHGRISVHLP